MFLFDSNGKKKLRAFKTSLAELAFKKQSSAEMIKDNLIIFFDIIENITSLVSLRKFFKEPKKGEEDSDVRKLIVAITRFSEGSGLGVPNVYNQDTLVISESLLGLLTQIAQTPELFFNKLQRKILNTFKVLDNLDAMQSWLRDEIADYHQCQQSIKVKNIIFDLGLKINLLGTLDQQSRDESIKKIIADIRKLPLIYIENCAINSRSLNQHQAINKHAMPIAIQSKLIKNLIKNEHSSSLRNKFHPIAAENIKHLYKFHKAAQWNTKVIETLQKTIAALQHYRDSAKRKTNKDKLALCEQYQNGLKLLASKKPITHNDMINLAKNSHNIIGEHNKILMLQDAASGSFGPIISRANDEIKSLIHDLDFTTDPEIATLLQPSSATLSTQQGMFAQASPMSSNTGSTQSGNNGHKPKGGKY